MTLDDIRAEWNSDAFMIPPSSLMRLCKQIAGRQQKEASLLKQPCDCTAERLFALYYAQRGRCNDTGIPMTYVQGSRCATSIEIDHIEQVMRPSSFESVSNGGGSVGGMSGMMANIRFVCRLAHQLRHKMDGFAFDRQQIYARLYVAIENGAPRNPDIDINHPATLISCQRNLNTTVAEFMRSRLVAPSCKQVSRYISDLGMLATPQQLYRAIAEAGVCGRTDRQKSRVAIAVGMLSENETFVLEVSANRISSELKNSLRNLTGQLAEDDVTDTSLRDDLRIAYQLVTGREAPAVAASSAESNGYIKRKLKIWSKPSAALRGRALDCIKSFGREGVTVDKVVEHIKSNDVVANHDPSGQYASMLDRSVRIVVQELVCRRMIDVDGGIATARLRTPEAASYCGYAGSYLNKCHKHGIGPVCEIGAPGVGSCLTFSYAAIDRWVEQRDAVRLTPRKSSLSA